MTRVLLFDGAKGAKRFELLRIALLNYGDAKGERGPAVLRKEARLLDALDTVSAIDPASATACATCGRPKDVEARILIEPGGAVTLAQEDCDLLNSYVEKTPWNPRVARDAVDVLDWLSASEKHE